MRQLVIDTETTGLSYSQGHRIIEIGCVEMVNRRLTDKRFHSYINPNRSIDSGAIEVHGITEEFLQDKPHFADIAEEFYEFIKGADLIAHNATFDIGFIDHEFKLWNEGFNSVVEVCEVIDTLKIARKKHPGQRNSLDALCKRYNITHFNRDLHGALLDAEILAQVYLVMTGGQAALFAEHDGLSANKSQEMKEDSVKKDRSPLVVIRADQKELKAHDKFLQMLQKKSEKECVWLKEG